MVLSAPCVLILYQLSVADCGWLQTAGTRGLCGERGDRTMRSGDCRPVAQSRDTSNGGVWLQQLQTLVNSFVRPLDVCQSHSVFFFVVYLLRESPRLQNDQPSEVYQRLGPKSCSKND